LVVVHDQDASALGNKEYKEAGEEALAVGGLAKEREDVAKVLGSLEFDLGLDLNELLTGGDVIWVVWACMEIFEDS
jgi:hypothetical protein